MKKKILDILDIAEAFIIISLTLMVVSFAGVLVYEIISSMSK